MLRLALALLLLAGTAAAQTTPLRSGVSTDQRAQFRICRAAVFYHLAPGARHVAVAPEVAEALRQQVAFAMHETLRNAPGGSVADARAAIDFAENFFLSFGATIREQQALQDDVAARERLLIDCVPMIWTVVAQHLDPLMARREGTR